MGDSYDCSSRNILQKSLFISFQIVFVSGLKSARMFTASSSYINASIRLLLDDSILSFDNLKRRVKIISVTRQVADMIKRCVFSHDDKTEKYALCSCGYREVSA